MSDKAKPSTSKSVSPKTPKRKSSQVTRSVNTSLREARFLSPRAFSKRTRCYVNFYLDKSYSLSCTGKPDQKLLSILYHFVDSDSRANPLASTDPVTSQDLASLNLSSRKLIREKSSDESSSSPSPSPSLLTIVKKGKTKGGPSVPKVKFESDISTATSDTEKLSDSIHSPPALTRALSSGSDSQSDCSAKSCGRGKAKKAKPTSGRSSDSASSSPLPGTSTADPYLDRPHNPTVPVTWDTETVPVALISTRAKKLHQTHKKQQKHIHPSYKVSKSVSEFLDQAEEELVCERLSLEYYSAERSPLTSAARGVKPAFYYRAYKQHREIKRLSGLIHSLNEIKLAGEESVIESGLDYYWDLNKRGFELFNEELQIDPETPYTPAVYREKIIISDICRVTEHKINHQIQQEADRIREEGDSESQEFFQSSQI